MVYAAKEQLAVSAEGVDAKSAQGATFITGYVNHARRRWARSSKFVKEICNRLVPVHVMRELVQ